MQTTLINYAAMLFDSGDSQAARALEERALESSVRRLGADHPDTLSVMAGLGATLKKLGEHSLASLSIRAVPNDAAVRGYVCRIGARLRDLGLVTDDRLFNLDLL